jgi:hypothetical protein
LIVYLKERQKNTAANEQELARVLAGGFHQKEEEDTAAAVVDVTAV